MVPEGVVPRFLCLPVRVDGVDDSALQGLSARGDVVYIEREFRAFEGGEGLIGVWLVYVELRLSAGVRWVERRLGERAEVGSEVALDREGEQRVVRLRAWRQSVSVALKLPAYRIFNNRQMREIARRAPRSLSQLSEVEGIGDQRLRRYGESILAVLRDGADPLSWPLGVRSEDDDA